MQIICCFEKVSVTTLSCHWHIFVHEKKKKRYKVASFASDKTAVKIWGEKKILFHRGAFQESARDSRETREIPWQLYKLKIPRAQDKNWEKTLWGGRGRGGKNSKKNRCSANQTTLSLSASLSAAPSQKLPEGHPRLKASIRNTLVSKTIV